MFFREKTAVSLFACKCLMFFLCALLAACSRTETESPEQSMVDKAPAGSSALAQAQKNTNWRYHGNDLSETRFSKLDKINETNVADLGLAWYIDLPEAKGQEATPLVIDGVMYSSAAWSHVYAINAVTGEILWHFDPEVDKAVRVKGCCGPVNRGLAYSNGMLFIGAYDGRLIAIDADSGKKVWETQTVDITKSYTVTGAPRIANGKVFIGNGGAEFGVRGYVSAYDENTGKLIWRFYTTPNHPDQPQENPIHNETVKTWSGEFWKLGGGATVWDSMAFDAELNLLYIGTGNSSPWNPVLRTEAKGDNLFVSSIVALNPDTGRYVWHFQTTPQDAWDYTATQHMILTDLDIEGQSRKVIMQAPKNGFFYVLDRKTGEFISGQNYVPVNWASGLDENGRPIVNESARYWEKNEPALITPAWSGGHNWHPMSYSSQTGLVYLPAQEMAFPYAPDRDFEIKQLAVNLGIDTTVAAFPDDPKVVQAIKEATKGHLSAWDPVKQKEVWRVQYPGLWNGGVLSTAGNLVFQGSATGFINAYRATTGEKLWEYPAQTGVVAPPMTYEVNGEQYIAVAAGWGGIYPLMTGPLSHDSHPDPVNRSRLLVFKLAADEKLPEMSVSKRKMQDLRGTEIDANKVEQGHVTWERYCVSCHGTGAVGSGVLPDLRYSPLITSEQAFYTVVGEGALAANGMVGFKAELSREQIENIRHFVIERNHYANKIGDTQRSGR